MASETPLFDWKPPADAPPARVPYLNQIENSLSADYVEWVPNWKTFRDRLSIFWLSMVTGLSQFEGTITEAFATAALDMTEYQQEGFEGAHFRPLETVSVKRRVNLSASEETGDIALLDNTIMTLSLSEAKRIAELNEYQLLFLQKMVTSDYLPEEVFEGIPMLKQIRAIAAHDANPAWLNYGYRGLLLSIYVPSRMDLIDKGMPMTMFDGSAFDQSITLEEIRRAGSLMHNRESSERARNITSHLSKAFHRIVLTNAMSGTSPVPNSLQPFAGAALEIEGASEDIVESEFMSFGGHFRRVVELAAGYISDWFILRNYRDLYGGFAIDREAEDKEDWVRTEYTNNTAAAAKELIEFSEEMTGIDIAGVADFFGIQENFGSMLKVLDYTHDREKILDKLLELRAELSKWMLEKRAGNMVTSSLYMVSLSRLLQTNILRGLGQVLPPRAIKASGSGNNNFPDGIIVGPAFNGSGGDLWEELAGAGEKVGIVEIKGRNTITPPLRALKSDIRQVREQYLDNLAIQGVHVNMVYFVYISPTGNKLVPMTVAELNNIYDGFPKDAEF